MPWRSWSDVILDFLEDQKLAGKEECNAFHEDNVLYSYRRSYPIGLRNGGKLYVHDERYSKTTTAQQRFLEHAAEHRQFKVVRFATLADLEGKIRELRERA